jgi:hypothetical protein
VSYAPEPDAPHRHRSASRPLPPRVRAARAVGIVTLILAAAVSAFTLTDQLPVSNAQPQTLGSALGLGGAAAQAGTLVSQTEVTKVLAASAIPQPVSAPAVSPPLPVYLNPLRAISGLVPERVDMGVDFGGSGDIYALGNGVVMSAEATNSGWPGGGFITYQLTNGPAQGLVVYVAEDVTPMVQVGQDVTSSTVIAHMFDGADGIETGWAAADSSTAESALSAAGGIGGLGPFPTEVGLSFDGLLVALGVPAAPNAVPVLQGFGLLPSNIPAGWSGVT